MVFTGNTIVTIIAIIAILIIAVVAIKWLIAPLLFDDVGLLLLSMPGNDHLKAILAHVD